MFTAFEKYHQCFCCLSLSMMAILAMAFSGHFNRRFEFCEALEWERISVLQWARRIALNPDELIFLLNLHPLEPIEISLGLGLVRPNRRGSLMK
jgi:hypothetical protein